MLDVSFVLRIVNLETLAPAPAVGRNFTVIGIIRAACCGYASPSVTKYPLVSSRLDPHDVAVHEHPTVVRVDLIPLAIASRISSDFALIFVIWTPSAAGAFPSVAIQPLIVHPLEPHVIATVDELRNLTPVAGVAFFPFTAILVCPVVFACAAITALVCLAGTVVDIHVSTGSFSGVFSSTGSYATARGGTRCSFILLISFGTTAFVRCTTL